MLNNNNKQLFTRMYGVAIALILGVLSLAVQAQYSAEPTDFDRLLSGEFNAVSPPNVATTDCDAGGDTNTFDCSGVLYLRFSPTLNIGDSTAGGNQLVVRMEARAGQEPIGTRLHLVYVEMRQALKFRLARVVLGFVMLSVGQIILPRFQEI